jgi:hypothetical protein
MSLTRVRILISRVPRLHWARAWLLCFPACDVDCNWRPIAATPRFELPLTISSSGGGEPFTIESSEKLALPSGDHWIELRVVIAKVVGARWIPARNQYRSNRPYTFTDAGEEEVRFRSNWPAPRTPLTIPPNASMLKALFARFSSLRQN